MVLFKGYFDYLHNNFFNLMEIKWVSLKVFRDIFFYNFLMCTEIASTLEETNVWTRMSFSSRPCCYFESNISKNRLIHWLRLWVLNQVMAIITFQYSIVKLTILYLSKNLFKFTKWLEETIIVNSSDQSAHFTKNL